MNNGILRWDKSDSITESIFPNDRSKKKKHTGINTVIIEICNKIRYFWPVLYAFMSIRK